MSFKEKEQVKVDTVNVNVSQESVVESQIDVGAERRATRKFDIYVVFFATMFYFLNFLDRANIGNARVAGLQKDLKMTNAQYSMALTVTYIPYIVVELPSNLIIKRVSPNILLPTAVVLWGIVTTLQGVVTNYGGLITCRFFLGLFEGGLLPGLLLYLSSFYKRHQLQTRVAMLFSATSLAGAFSGLLAAAIVNLHGKGGKPGWAWIFILEGIATTVFGAISFFFMPQSPSTARFLSEEEKVAIERALRLDGAGDEDTHEFSWGEVVAAFKAPHVWLLSIGFFFGGTGLFGLAFFTPTIVRGLGYSATRTQLMSVPPYAVSFVVSLAASWYSDRYRQRALVAGVASLVALAGFSIFLGTGHIKANYGALFLQIMGVYTAAPTLSAWNANNVQPHYKRATGIAVGFITTNAGGILSAWIYDDGPRYRKGTSILVAFMASLFAVSIANWAYLKRKNDEKAAIIASGNYDRSEAAKNRDGDEHPEFTYTL